jgi:lipopolysaccharide biosynthesis glycosyltransferase
MKNKIVFFTIADEANMPYAKKLEASLKKFHPDIPLVIVTGELLKNTLAQDPQFYYRSTPAVARDLIKEYEIVIKIDADSIVCGDLSHTWDSDFDVACVNNSNPLEMKKYPVTVWNIHPLSYLNAGYVVMKSEAFIDHWFKLCTSPHFNFYQFREQDLLNIMVFYGTYHVKFLDAGQNWHGLITKGYWPKIIIESDKLVLPKQEDWNKENKTVKIIHWAGGNMPNKMNVHTAFKPEVAKWLTAITNEEI